MIEILKSSLGYFDWDFKDLNTKEMFPHNLSWYPSRYIPQIPAMLINEFSKEGDSVMDPFCGSGTTLIEAVRLRRKCFGFDINPVATFMTEVKIKLLDRTRVSEGEIFQVVNEISNKNYSISNHIDKCEGKLSVSNIEELKCWYHKETLNNLAVIWSVIDEQNGFLKDVLKLVFISILIPCSGLENKKPYTYYADKVFPKDDILRKDAFHIFKLKVARLIEGLREIKSISISNEKHCENLDIVQEDIRCFGGFDLIVTSPPYLNVTDYITGFRLAHLWYDFGNEMSLIKTNEMGARWKRKRSSSFEDYMAGMKKTLSKICNSLNNDGHLCLVIGESAKYQEKIISPLTNFLTEELSLHRQVWKERSVNQNYFIHPTGGVKKEEILVFKK